MEPFGVLKDGCLVHAVTLGSTGGLRAEVLTYGGILRRLVFPVRGKALDLIVTLPDLDAYAGDTTFQGILVGRVANRIANARFELNARTHRLPANNGANHLHGGPVGFGKRLWRVLDEPHVSRHRLRLGLHSPAGEQGYPGNLDVTAEIVVEPAELRIHFEARCDEDTPLNLTCHPYFNFSGDATRKVENLLLRIPASRFLPVKDSQLIPTGEMASVEGTPFDFRALRSVKAPSLDAHPQLACGSGFDHCWVLDAARDCDAELVSRESGVRMTIHSGCPGIQFYGGQHLAAAHPGLNGICLEPQGLPNAMNEPSFPSTILAAGDTHRSTLIYRFSTCDPETLRARSPSDT